MVSRLALFGCASLAFVPVFAWAPPAMVAAALLVVAFASLNVRRISIAPSRTRRVTLGIGARIASAMAASLFRQLPVRDRITAFHCAAIAVGAMLALFTMPSPPHVAFVFVVALLLTGSRICWRLLVIEPLPAHADPSPTITVTRAVTWSVACVTALGQARHRWRVDSVPQRAS
jgi:xanthosine utilization system XapX-like protein